VAQGFGEDVRNVVLTSYSRNLDIAKGNIVTDGVEFDPNVFHLRVKDLVFRKSGGGIVIAIDRRASSAGEPEAVQELL